MRYPLIAAGSLLLPLALAGCQSDNNADDGEQNSMMIKFAQDQNVRNGIVSQRTVYPYHFEPGTAAFTDLGDRAVEMLAGAYRGVPVEINVIRGDASPDLYRLRVQAVRQKLLDAGLNASALTLSDGLPGGPGIPSEYVADFLGANKDAPAPGEPSRPSSGSSSSASSPTQRTGQSTPATGFPSGNSGSSFFNNTGGK